LPPAHSPTASASTGPASALSLVRGGPIPVKKKHSAVYGAHALSNEF
jgi:hypothetical protein